MNYRINFQPRSITFHYKLKVTYENLFLNNKPIMPSQVSVLNKYVVNFFKSHKLSDQVLDAWEDKQNQMRLKKTIKKQKLAHPKGVSSKYIFFCRDERKAIIEENPSMPMKDIARIMGPRWAALKSSTEPEDIKRMEKYTAMYEAEQQRYQEDKSKIIPEKTKKEPVINTAYKAFCAEERNAGNKSTIVELNQKWKDVKTDKVLMERYKEIAGKI